MGRGVFSPSFLKCWVPQFVKANLSYFKGTPFYIECARNSFLNIKIRVSLVVSDWTPSNLLNLLKIYRCVLLFFQYLRRKGKLHTIWENKTQRTSFLLYFCFFLGLRMLIEVKNFPKWNKNLHVVYLKTPFSERKLLLWQSFLLPGLQL